MSANNKKILGIHFGLVLAELICVSAFVFELRRATSGNSLSWAYVFEWPLFGGYAIYMWRRLLKEERGEDTPREPTTSTRADDQLRAYNEYLRSIHGVSNEEHRTSGHASE